MDKSEFVKQQYISLREEVRETKTRIFKTMSFGLIVVPVAHFAAKSYSIDAIVLSLPGLVVVVALIFLSENNALMRCGRYIKDHVESEFDDVTGWEKFLEKEGKFEARAVDKYLSYAFYLLFLVYFAFSIFLAVQFASQEYGANITRILLCAYLIIGFGFAVFLFKSIKTSTSTKQDNCTGGDR